MSDDGGKGTGTPAGTPDSDAFAETIAPVEEISTAQTTADVGSEKTMAAGSDETVAATPGTTGGRAINLRAGPLTQYKFDDRYKARDLLGKGGMGEVQLCRDGVVGRSVAMKTIHSHHSGNADTLARFLREARVQGQLEHPSIVPVYDMGVDENGAPYFTMKRLKGMTLHTILRKLRDGKADADVTATFTNHKLLSEFTNVCQAMEFAHSRGVVHRDLKPDNIMLGDFGEVYVLDWGIAKIAGVDDEEVSADAGDSARIDTGQITTEKTAYGAVLGTPGYMAPEQIRGEVDAIGASVDVYALGAVLFEILTLQRLHQGKTGAALIASTSQGADATASTRAPERNVPPELEAICVKATSLHASDRYSSVRELGDAVEAFLAGDRDLEQRRQLATGYAEQAATMAARILQDEEDTAQTRREAMRTASRALALDPENESAAYVISQLMLTPPKRIPDEVEQETHASLQKRAVLHVRGAAWTYVACLSFLPLYVWMGIKDWTVASITAVLIVASAGIAAYGTRPGKLTRPLMHIAIVINTLFIIFIGRAFGWIVLAPALAAVSTVAFLLQPHLQRPSFTVVCGVAAIMVPFTLELTGVLPSSYTFSDGVMIARSTMFDLKRGPFLLTFALSACTLIVTTALLVLNNQRASLASERQLHLQAWQMRQLMPERSHDE